MKKQKEIKFIFVLENLQALRKHRIHIDPLNELCATNFNPNQLLGQYSSRTTEIYTHVSNHRIQKIKSHFDDL
ncbi:MAG: hypothetical protein IPH93_17705 [Saprospiraceae bacterium]|nr:hypothetical protein [Saprospiraceae bacterium]MBK7809770.1 hypothetical protein [Saprospiraceae bacterium]